MRIDENQVADLLRRLDDEPTRPPRVDLAGAIREARRRRRNRRVTAAGAAALGVLAVAVLPVALPGADRTAPAPATSASPSTPAPKPSPTGPWLGQCTATQLPVPGGDPRGEVTGGDPDGRWLVGRGQPQGRLNFRLLIWDGDQVREVEMPGSAQELVDVNRAGLAVGWSMGARDGSPAWAVRDGKVLSLPGVISGGAMAVNDAGQIVGWRSVRGPGEPGVTQTPVVWDSYRSEAVDLPLPEPRWEGQAIGIDEDGTILASMSEGRLGAATRAVVWRPGAARPEVLPLPQVPGGVAFQFEPLSLSGGWVTGIADRYNQPGVPRSGTNRYPVRINLRTGEADVLKGVLFNGTGNGRGWVAGWLAGDVPGLLTDTESVKLPVPDGWRGEARGGVRSFSDDSRVLGGQLQFDDQGGRPVRWTCR
ncbi:hypothetical protein [Micromonospora avicenniae]|uniref:hypothetical protein n=1 Tax=Micromonospora avicenniae TaxID=1198245 RepID=UPI0033172297